MQNNVTNLSSKKQMIVTSARNVTKVIETTISQQIIEKEVESDNEYSTLERK